MRPVGFEIKAVLGENIEPYIEFSGILPFASHEQVVHRRMILSDFRRFIGYSDQQYDDFTTTYRSTLRATPSHDPAQSANIDNPRARLESCMTAGKPKCCHLVPHLLSLEIALWCKSENSTEKTLDLDHRAGFTVCKVGSARGWSLLHPLITALTIHQPSYESSVLDLHYYYHRRAVKDEIVDPVSTVGFLALFKLAAENCTADWDMTAQAMDSYMEYLVFGPYTFILVQPPSNKMTVLSCVFTVPRARPEEVLKPESDK